MKDILLQRIEEKIRTVCIEERPEFTDFLNVSEQRRAHDFLNKDTSVYTYIYQSFMDDERVMLGIFPAAWTQYMSPSDFRDLFPVDVFHITSSDIGHKTLEHRALLGSLLGLGIDRRLVGDLLVLDEDAYVACHERIRPLLLNEFRLAGNRSINCQYLEDAQSCLELSPNIVEISSTIASNRLDNILKVAIQKARGTSSTLIEGQRVKVNQEVVTKSHSSLEEGDVISVGGYGKYKITGLGPITKKGRLQIRIHKYI